MIGESWNINGRGRLTEKMRGGCEGCEEEKKDFT